MIAFRSKSSPFVLEIKFKSIWNYSHCTVADGASRQAIALYKFRMDLKKEKFLRGEELGKRPGRQNAELRKILAVQAVVS